MSSFVDVLRSDAYRNEYLCDYLHTCTIIVVYIIQTRQIVDLVHVTVQNLMYLVKKLFKSIDHFSPSSGFYQAFVESFPPKLRFWNAAQFSSVMYG